MTTPDDLARAERILARWPQRVTCERRNWERRAHFREWSEHGAKCELCGETYEKGRRNALHPTDKGLRPATPADLCDDTPDGWPGALLREMWAEHGHETVAPSSGGDGSWGATERHDLNIAFADRLADAMRAALDALASA